MRRLAFVSLAVAAACGTQVQGNPAPLDQFYKPTGIAFHDGSLLVASSNFDLLYTGNEGGTVIAVDPSTDPAVLRPDGVHVGSFTGDLAVTDGCQGATAPYAIVASRFSNVLYQLKLGPTGVSCDAGDAATPCQVPLGNGSLADPLAVEVVCKPGAAPLGRHSAFFAYLRSFDGRGWVSEYTLGSPHELRSFAFSAGVVRSFEYDPVHDRLWMAILATSARAPLAWMELGGGCKVDSAGSDGCTFGSISLQQMPAALEVRDIAFANQSAPGQDQSVRRVYFTGRLYDVNAAATVGGRTTDLGGLIVVADLVENALGGVDMQVVRTIEIGRGAGAIRVLPPRGADTRDIVAALATDEGELWLYDDETLAVKVLGRSPTAGAPVLGHVPYALAFDPTVIGSAHGATNVVRLYVASFQESFVTPVDVPLDDVESACMLDDAGLCAPDDGTSPPRRITGGAR